MESNRSLQINQLFQSGHQMLPLEGHGARPSCGEVGVPRTLDFGRAWPNLGLLAIEGEHIFLVSSDQDNRRSEVPGQGLQPGHIQRARALPLPPYGQGAGQGRRGRREITKGLSAHSPARSPEQRLCFELLPSRPAKDLSLLLKARIQTHSQAQSVSEQSHGL